MLDRPDFIWTDEAIATLKDHWTAGLSCSQIAVEMGKGLTRNSIIGKVTRLKLPKRGRVGHHTTRAQRTDARMQREPVKPHGNKGQPKVNAIVASARARIAPPPEPFDAETDIGIDVTHRVGIMDLTSHTCRWPVGRETGARQMFCGCHADHQAVANAARQLDMDWPRAALDDPMITGDRHILYKSRVAEADALKQGATIIEAMFVDAEGFATLFELAAKKKWAFDSCVLLARQELAVKDQPAEKAA